MTIKVPAIGLTFARDMMPQLNAHKFIDSLKAQGVGAALTTLDPAKLKASQAEFDFDKVRSLMDYDGTPTPIIVSKDDHILDGHHRWLADHNNDSMTTAFKVNMPILDLLHRARHFAKNENPGPLQEGIEHKEFGPMLDSFVKFASDHLGIESLPNVRFKADDDDYNSFAAYNPSQNELSVKTLNRHPMDIFRSVAHELVHHKQNEEGRIKDAAKDGLTGSDIENEANAIAGQIMRHWAKNNPNHFEYQHVAEAVFVVGGPCSGKDRIAKTIVESMEAREYDPFNIQKANALPLKIVVSASANDLEAIMEAKDLLEYNGYLTSLVHVEVSNEISKLRNEERRAKGQKVISEAIRFKKYMSYTDNMETLLENFEVVGRVLNEACWKGYAVPKEKKFKKKGDKLVPNCVPVKEEGGAGEWGTDKLRKRYEKDTPGSTKKLIRKKKLKETIKDPIEPYDIVGNDGIGDSATTHKPIYPSLGAASFAGLSESAKKWATNPSTINRFKQRYGQLAEQKILETAKTIKDTTPKSIKQLRESFDKGIGLMGTVPSQGKEEIEEDSPAWQRKAGKNPEGGLNKKGVESYRRANPGSKLQTAVTEKPSKLKPGSKKAKRRISFCKRMKGMKSKLTSSKTARDPDSRINKSLRKWNCEE